MALFQRKPPTVAERLSSAPQLLADAVRAIELPHPKVGDVLRQDVQLPDITLPRPRMGEINLQDVQLPDITLPRPRMGEINLQDLQLPDVTLPRPRLGEVKTREIGIRGPDLSDASRSLRRLVQLAIVAVAGTAIYTEMSKPEDQREWHGQALGVPYDFRPPTSERLRGALWNDQAGLITPTPWGMGWTINVHRALQMVRSRLDGRGHQEDAQQPTRMKAAPRRESVKQASEPELA